MANFLLNNMGGRNHSNIYAKVASNAIFDCSPTQLGWKDYESIHIGDHVFIIGESKNVLAEYKVTMIADGVLMCGASNDQFERLNGGDSRVLFGKLISEPKIPYGDFVLEHGIVYGKKFNPDTGRLTSPGFNCCPF